MVSPTVNSSMNSSEVIDLIESSGMIDSEVLGGLADRFRNDSDALLKEIVHKGYMSRSDAGELIAGNMGLSYVDPNAMDIDIGAEHALPYDIARKIGAIHLYEFGGVVTMAMTNPKDDRLVDSLERYLQFRVSPVFSFPEDIDKAISKYYDLDISYENALDVLEGESCIDLSDLSEKRMIEIVDSSELASLTNRMFVNAFRYRASDLHLESHDGYGLLRMRVDGRLMRVSKVPNKVKEAIIVRLKFLAGMDIANRLSPQDGRFTMDVASYKQDFRVSSCPGLFGEKMVVRILGNNGGRHLPRLDKLFFSASNLKRYRGAVSRPSGLFVVTGPTGMGKTTTLYSTINYINDDDKNVMTIENPVEYRLNGVNHFEVNYKSGLDFKTILRSALRQDPDILLVGEVRDQETATIAAEAALTGHLVFTTMHTNTALQAILRFDEIGVDPFVIAPSLNGVLSQRLVGRICEGCKYEYEPREDILSRYFLPGSYENPVLYRGRGCKACRMTGFSGRIAIQEVVEVSEEMRGLISRRASLKELQEASDKVGAVSLRMDGIMKALQGLTTIDEVERVTLPEYHS